MKRTEPQRIDQIIAAAMESAGVADTMAEYRACYAWPEVVGQGINRYTTRRYIAGGVMHVYLSSAPLRQELSFHRDRLAELLNKAVGTDVVKRIEFH